MLNKLKNLLKRNRFTNVIVTDYGFRTIAFSFVSFSVGIAYAVFNLAVGIVYRSLWYGSLACYYIMLGVIRGGVLLNRYRSRKLGNDPEPRVGINQYIFCGVLFILMTVFLGAMVLHIARQDKTFEYSAVIIYMAAGYTFYRIAISVYNFIKAGKQPDYTVRSLRCINLVTALVSFLSLQSAALAAFSKNIDQIFMNALTGVVVCAMIILLGAFMIVSAAVKLKAREGHG